MSGWRGWAEIRRIVRPGSQLEDDLEAELSFHVQGRIDELEAEGWTRDDARDEVLRNFGNPGTVERECREISDRRISEERRVERMGIIKQDARYALRALRRNPGFAVVAVLTLALGIGATTAIFSVVDAVVFRPLPYQDPGRLVSIFEQHLPQGVLRDRPSPPNFWDWHERNATFDGMVAIGHTSATLSSTELPEVLAVGTISWDLLPVLGVEPILGRTFSADEGVTGGPDVALISHRLWGRLFEGGRDVLTKRLVLNDTPFDIVGVLPEAFDLPRDDIDIWIPADWSNPGHHRQTRDLLVIGRLKDDVTIQTARVDLNRVAVELAREYPESNEGWTVGLTSTRDEIVGDTSAMLMIVFGAVGFVLLIACANVANLMLGRSAYRSREIGVRSAMGASAARIRQQLLTESLVLGVTGGLLGIAIAVVGVRVFQSVTPQFLPRANDVTVDVRVLMFALTTSVLASVLFGLVPSIRASRVGATEGLGSGKAIGAGSRQTAVNRRALVVGEVAVSLVLLVGAGLLLKSFLQLRQVDPGFDPKGVVVSKVSLSNAGYPDKASRVRYFESLLEELRVVPGVSFAGVTSTLPMDFAGIDFNLPYVAEGQPMRLASELPETDYRIISPGYLEAMSIDVLKGRRFTDLDRAETQRVIQINETFAEQLWPGEDPIGKSITIFYVEDVSWEVVGVVEDTRHRALGTPPEAQFFVPLAQAEMLFGYMTIVAKADASTADVVDGLRAATVRLDPKFPLYRIETAEALTAETIERDRFAAVLIGAFALLALVLAAAGIYGVVAYQVAGRTREIGLRMALGAARGSVLSGVLKGSLGMALTGVAIGLVGALAATRLLAGMLFIVSPLDLTVYVGVAAILLAVAIVASLLPAVRASAVDPVRALRSE